jgi:hypothetical protein
MKESEIRIRCRGYFDERLTSLKRIEEVMDDIESFVIERPLFDNTCREEHKQIDVAGLEKIGIGGLVGWCDLRLSCPATNM